jgi:murein L,D-transpeptidase YafK
LTAGGRRALTQATVALHRARSELRRGDSEASARSARDSAASSRTVLSVAGRLVARLTDDEAIEDWQQWVAETVSWSARHGSSAIVVDKASRRLLYYDRGRLLREFHADLGRNPISDKLREGDNATPEGRYRVSQVKGPGQSRYYRAFLIDYPNAKDRKAFDRARRSGVIPRNSQIGGLIEIHGHGGRREDWTNGCVAVTDEVMDFLAQKVVLGTPVTIVGALRHPPLPAALKAGMGTSGGRP